MNNKYDTFVIKISGGVLPRPRGSIQHVASQEVKHFEGFVAMNDFISRHIKLSERPNDLTRSENVSTNREGSE